MKSTWIRLSRTENLFIGFVAFLLNQALHFLQSLLWPSNAFSYSSMMAIVTTLIGLHFGHIIVHVKVRHPQFLSCLRNVWIIYTSIMIWQRNWNSHSLAVYRITKRGSHTGPWQPLGSWSRVGSWISVVGNLNTFHLHFLFFDSDFVSDFL